MFRANETVIYTPFYKDKGLDPKPVKAIFLRINSENKAVILVKKGTEYTYKRTVNIDLLEKKNGWYKSTL